MPTSPTRSSRRPLTRGVLGLTAASLAVLTVAGWPGPALPEVELDSPRASRPSLAPVTVAEVASEARRGADLRALSGRIEPLPLEPVAEYAGKAEKKLAKLQKKQAKKDAKLAATESSIDDLSADLGSEQTSLSDAQSALSDAEALPEETAEQQKVKKSALKAAKKALKKAQKAVAKLQKKLTKLDAKVEKIEGQILVIEDQVSDLEEQVGGVEGGLGVLPLSIPTRMDLLVAEDGPGAGGGSGILPGGSPSGLAPGFAPDSDYVTDPQHAYVWDPATESLDTVNNILCMLQQTAYDVMVNRGTYTAQIDESVCDAGSSDGSSGGSDGGQSSSQTEELQLWTVRSARADDESRHFVQLWVPGDDDGPPDDGTGEGPGDGPGEGGATIQVLLTIEEGASELNPFGVFHMNFAGVPDGGGPEQPMFHGTLSTQEALEGFMGFQFFETAGDPEHPEFPWYETRQVHVNTFVDGSQGVAHVLETSGFPSFDPQSGQQGELVEETIEYVVAFDDDHILRAKVGDDPTCLDRQAFDTNVWRYGLYHGSGPDAGERVALNSGFPIRTDDDVFGWAGYWGIWLPDDAGIETGTEVFQDTWGEDEVDPETYTVLQAPGKLFKNSRNSLALADVDGAHFEWWFVPPPALPEGDPSGEGGDPGDGLFGAEPEQLLVTYDHTTGQWLRIGAWDYEFGEYDLWDEIDQLPIDFEEEGIYWMDMWSSSLGGMVNFIPGESEVTFFQEQIIRPDDELFGGDGTLELLGFTECLEGDITGSEADEGAIYLDDSYDLAEPHRYVFDASDMTLYLDVDGDGLTLVPVGLGEGEQTSGDGPYEWGMRSGPMLVSTDGMTDVWEAWGQEVFFVYETGPNEWNRYTGLVDGEGELVTFDAPLQFTYEHSTLDDVNGDSEYDGKKFLLEYGGHGDLWGFPHEGVDSDGDGYKDRFYPTVNLADGTVVGPEGEYVVKALDMEQTMSEVGGGECFELNVDTVQQLPLPDGSSYSVPDIGDEPEVDDAPAVAKGEVQFDLDEEGDEPGEGLP